MLRIYQNHTKIIAICIVLLSILGCSKDEEPRFTIPVEATFYVPSGLNTFETHYIPVYNIPIFLNSYLQQNNMTLDQITSIVSGRGRIIPISSNIEYRFYNDLAINAFSIINHETFDEMYYNDFIQLDHSGDLELLSSISELKDIMINGVFDMEVRINFRQNTATTTEHRIVFDLAVYD